MREAEVLVREGSAVPFLAQFDEPALAFKVADKPVALPAELGEPSCRRIGLSAIEEDPACRPCGRRTGEEQEELRFDQEERDSSDRA